MGVSRFIVLATLGSLTIASAQARDEARRDENGCRIVEGDDGRSAAAASSGRGATSGSASASTGSGGSSVSIATGSSTGGGASSTASVASSSNGGKTIVTGSASGEDCVVVVPSNEKENSND